MSRSLRLFVTLSLLLQTLGLMAHPTYVYAEENAEAIADYLAEFGTKLDTLESLEELGAEIPFTAVTPSDWQALDLTHLFGTTLEPMGTYTGDIASLAGMIDSLDTNWSQTGMQVTYGGVTVTDGDIVEVTFSVTATHDTTLPVGYYTDALPLPEGITVPLDLDGGEMDISLLLSTTFDFGFDKDLHASPSDSDLAFYLASEPVMDVSISASGPITPFQDLLGFTDIDVSGVVTLNQKIEVQFVDPDDIAPFTWREWTQTAIEDLVVVAFVDADGNDVEGTLTFDSDLVGGTEDGSLSLLIEPLSAYQPPADPLPDPTITLSSNLAKLANVGPNDVLAGLGQFAIAIGAAQITNDVQLPYLQHPLSAGFEPGRALFELAKQQGDAFIMCGPGNTLPPSGDPTAGGTIYCQTFAPTDPFSVTWSIRDCPTATIVSEATAIETVGVRPTENVEFSNLPEGELPPIQVKFRDPPGSGGAEGAVHTVTPRIRSAQELLTELENLDGVTAASLQFDQAMASLTFSITMEWDPDVTPTALAFGDQLRQAANLSGLSAVPGAEASFDVDGAHLAATFGVILVDDYADITPSDTEEPRPDDRFFMVVDPTAGAYEFQAEDLTVDTIVDLVGHIGFLEVTVKGDETKSTATSSTERIKRPSSPLPQTIFLPFVSSGFALNGPESAPSLNGKDLEIGPITDTLPVLAVDINPRPGGIPISGTAPIADAILVRSLLSDTASHVTRWINLQMSAGLAVSATLSGSGPLIGNVAINWPDMSTGQPIVTPDAAFRTTLQRFDVVPTVTGFHDGVDDSTVLTDTARGDTLPAFPDTFGLSVNPGHHMTTMLHNLTAGSSCTSFFVTADDTLTCAEFVDGVAVPSTLQGEFGIEGPDPEEFDYCADGYDNDNDGDIDDADTDCQEGGIGWERSYCNDGYDNDNDGDIDNADTDCDTNDWDAGDQYLIPGDPQALGTVVLQNLYDLAARMSTVTTGTWSTSQALPMIGLSPKELVPQFAQVTQAIVDINEGRTAVQISCLSEDGADLVTAAPRITETVACSAIAPISTSVTDVRWTVTNGKLLSGRDNVHTVGTLVVSPTATMVFSTTDFTGLGLTVVVTDSEGIVRRGRLPQGPPLSLAELELDLESALGIPPGDLTFELIDLYSPAADDTLKHLVLRLGLEDQGQRDVRLRIDLPEAAIPADFPQEIVGTDFSPTLPMSYTARVRLDLGIPLSNTLAPSNTAVLNSTGAWLSASLETSTAELTATLGALSVRLGTGVITGTHTEDFAVGGYHTDEISSTTTLTDTAHSGTGNVDFLALPIRTGVTISNTTDGTHCTVTTVTSDTLFCAGGLSGEQWDQGDVYTVTGPSATTLYDPSRDFTTLGIEPGDTLRNETDGVECTIDTVSQHRLVCEEPLPNPNRWHQDDEYRIATAGLVKFDADFELANLGTGPFDLEDFISGLTTTIEGPVSNDCGAGAAGDVCARLGVAVVQSPPQSVGNLSFWMTDVGDATTAGGTIPDELAKVAAEEQLEWSILSLALPEMRFILEDNLDGAYWGQQIPLVGDDLAAGAAFDDPILALGIEIQHGIDTLNSEIEEGNIISATDIITELRQIVVGAVVAMSPTIGSASPVTVVVTCDGSECDDSHEVGDVDSVDVDFAVGHNLNAKNHLPQQGCANDTCGDDPESVDFAIGLPGLPLTSDEQLTSRVGWHLDIGFGLSRAFGPYLRVQDDDDLVLGARVTMPVVQDPGACTEEYKLGSVGAFEGIFADGTGPKGERRCIDGVVGFLEGTMYDGDGDGNEFGPDDDPTFLNLLTKLDIQGDGDRLTFGQLMDGTSGHEVQVEADANIDLSFSTGYGDRGLGFPPIVGTVHMSYTLSQLTEITLVGEDEWVGQPYYKNLYLDAGFFFGEFVAAMVEEVQQYTKPFQPVIDTITAPIPVISDLSEAVGGGEVTLLSLLEAVADNDLSMIERIADFITFFNNIPADQAFLLGLGPSTGDILQAEPGAFAVRTSTVIEPNCGEEGQEGDTCTQTPALGSAGKQWERFDVSTVVSGSLAELFLGETREAAGGASSADPGISYPFLNDTTEIFGMLLGEDADILYVNLGSFKASAGVSWTFGPFFAGPVPLNVSIGGSVTLQGRFAVGFDTRGLRSYIAGGSLVDVLIDGIYLDDYNLQGNEAPEVELILEFWAGASVGFYIFEAGLEAGATFNISLDLNDPNNDGKMYIDEILFWRFNPICLFEVRGTLEFFLKVYLEIDLFLFSKRFEWELYRTKPPIELFDVKCEPPVPKLAEEITDGDRCLYRLNMGDSATRGARNIFVDEEKEKFIVRQMTVEGEGCNPEVVSNSGQVGPHTECTKDEQGGTWVSVTFQGIQQDHYVRGDCTLYADAGSDNDVIKLLPGTDNEENEIPFTLDAELHGGDGDDEITTGDGDDVVFGDDNNDRLYVQGGNDYVDGGGGSDIIEGKTGEDIIYGGSGDDTLLNGGPGSDLVYGGPGNDILSGGPGLPPDLELTSGENIEEYKDFGDILLGGTDDDDLDGGFGDDYLFGDDIQGWSDGSLPTSLDNEADRENVRDLLDNPEGEIDEDDACGPTGSGTGEDQLTGGDGADHLFGGNGHDVLTSGEEMDRLCGNGGNDRLDAEDGDDRLQGGDGNDTLFGGPGHDSLEGDADDDLLYGGDDHDDLIGGEGYDILLGELGHDIALGDTGTIAEHQAADHDGGQATVLPLVSLLSPANSGDISCTLRVYVYSGEVDLDGDGLTNDNGLFEGYEVITGHIDLNHDASVTISDTGMIKETVVLSGRVDLDGDGDIDSNDTGLFQGAGAVHDDLDDGNADCLFGDVGDDYLFAGPGDDQMLGSEGVDYMEGNEGNDWMRGGKENDEMYGNAGSDVMYGDDDDDQMFGGSDYEENDADDEMYGNAGDDVMLGDNGQIIASASDTIETIYPQYGGDDTMYGNGGNDILLGGYGGDYIWGNTGEDVILGDNGVVNRDDDASVLRIESSYHVDGGVDTIEGNQAEDIILGGEEGDNISGDQADDTILGDNGVVVLEDGTDDGGDVYTTDPEYGGRDTISGDDGDDIILGGSGNDSDDGDDHDYVEDDDGTAGNNGDHITGNDGEDIILGDNGYISRTVVTVGVEGEYLVERIATTYPGLGGGDVISGNQMKDVILGGNASDAISGDLADDTILGDNGVVILEDDGEDGADVYTADPDDGGQDVISGDDGYDLILGGSGGLDLGEGNVGDTITGNDGEDIILGDNGYVARTEEYEVTRIATTYPCLGAGDVISGNQMKDIIIGGNTADTITGDDDDDTILGDNGVVVRTDYSGQDNDIYTTDPDCGGSDIIAGNQGDDIILGGSGGSDLEDEGGGDSITGNTEDDIILGDNGYITRDDDDVVEDARTTYPDKGGEDTIEGNQHDDIILGGADGDKLWGNTEDDIILGDNGAFDNRKYDTDLSTLDIISTTYPTIGGTDTVTAGAGIDLVFGGTLSDTISGNENHDILLGDHGLWDSTRPVDQPFLSIDTAEADLGGQDTIHGNDGDDFILGGQGGDFLYGDLDQDDMTGGHNVPGGADGDDKMYGDREDAADGDFDGSHSDVMIGDNGVITRTIVPPDTWLGETWVPNRFNDTVARVIELYDVERVNVDGEEADDEQVDPTFYGNDLMYGHDNDDIMYGQNGEDNMYGGAGDDYMEGNADSDYMEGDSEDDDMLGGSGPTISLNFDTECTGCTDDSTSTRTVPITGSAWVTVPLGDEMYGNAGSDVMLGDNGVISRPLDVNGNWLILEYSLFQDTIGGSLPRHPISGTAQRVDREVWMVDTDFGRTAGSDYIEGGPGDDDMYGQFDDTGQVLPGLVYSDTIGDEMLGNEGEDAMVGDQAVIDNWVIISDTGWIEPKEPFIDDHIYVYDTLFREVELNQIPLGGDDRMQGNDDGDWMHGGAGNDLMNGNDGNDRMFGDRGEDAMWGGLHHDHLWGGYDDDYLDVRPRQDDPARWHDYATDDHYQDVDYAYGGWDQDSLQANVGDEGPEIGDRLLDWVGAYNGYYLCPGLYGEFIVTRDHSPGLIAFLQELSQADGAVDTKVEGSSGFDELAMVFPNEAGDNSHPIHPDNPGHFVCGEPFPITPTVRSLAIELSASEKGGDAKVSSEIKVVRVLEGYDEVAAGATVTITWAVPGATEPVTQTAETNKKGNAQFSVEGPSGVYTLTISHIELAGYDFDPDRSQLAAWINTETGEIGTSAPSSRLPRLVAWVNPSLVLRTE
jgi:Ca2+-binding RTX toxin-like protein